MRSQGNIIKHLLAGCLLAVITAGCNDVPSEHTTIMPEVIRIAPVPDQSPETLQRLYEPLLDYLRKETGLPTKLVIADSYSHLLELFKNGQIDIANFGGITYIKAHKDNNAEALVLRDIDGLFSNVVLVRAEATASTLQELKGKSFSFGSKLSTSGHLMPRHFFAKSNIEPETFFARINFSGAHDKTAYLVRDKKVYAGVANSGIIDQMYNDGRLKKSQVPRQAG